MDFSTIFSTIPGTGWLSRPEALLLWTVAKRTLGAILEVGSYHGRSTCLLASLERPIYAVDPFYGFGDTDGLATLTSFQQNLRERHIHNVTLFQEKIEDWKRRPVSFAYLDGDHTTPGTISQIQAARDCGATDICIHDYAEKGEGLQIKHAIRDSGLVILSRIDRMVWCR